MKNETNVDPYVKWDNTCIKVLSKEHGAKVIEFWKSVGVETFGMRGSVINDHYGLFDGYFNGLTSKEYWGNKRILTLEEAIAIRDSETKTFPREMYVWDNYISSIEKQIVYFIIDKSVVTDERFIVVDDGQTFAFKNAMEVEEYEAMMKKENEDAKMKEWVSKVETLLLEVKPLVEREMLKYMNEDLRLVLNHAKEFIKKSDELKNKL